MATRAVLLLETGATASAEDNAEHDEDADYDGGHDTV